MIIREMILTSFGKFHNKKVQFKDGLNIVYGNNEAGKTTIHKFIEGMFFGFFKPYTKRRMYTDDYEKYYPWDNNDYAGVLKYSYDDVIYRIERNFIKGNESVKIIDDKTGEDVTYMFQYDKVKRTVDPSSIHLGLNSVVYNNTINIKQLASKTEKELAKEVKDNLINLGGSMDEDISVKKVIDELTKELNEIGTKKKVKTSPYGKIIDEIERLENEKVKAIKIMNQVKELQSEFNETYEGIRGLKETKLLIENNLILLESYKAKDKYDKVVKLSENIGLIEKDIVSLRNYQTINPEEYTEIIRLENTLENLIESLQKLEQKKIKLENKLKRTLKKDKNMQEGNLENLNEDFYRYEEIEEERDKLLYNNDDSKLILFRNRFDEKEKGFRKIKMYKFSSIILSIIIGVIGAIIKPIYSLIAIIPIILFIYFIVAGKEKNDYLNKLAIQIEGIEKERDNTKKKIIILESEMKDILIKYECLNKTDLKRKIHEYSNQSKTTGLLRQELEELNQEIKALKKEKSIYEKELRIILEKNNVNNIEEYKQALAKKKRYDELIKQLENDNSLLTNILGDNSVEYLKKKSKKCDKINSDEIKKLNRQELEEKLKHLSQELNNKQQEVTRLDVTIKNLMKQSRNIVEIDEEIIRKTEIKDKYEEKMDSLQLAIETIEKISRSIQIGFAPKLNKKVSEIISSITDGKYNDVKITENIDIKVVDPDTHNHIDIEELSSGTVDQMYFATRFGIIDVIKEQEKLPLILDDCFVQYDQERLRNILKFLKRESEKRQVILFSCHTREKELLDMMNVEYNYVELS